MLRRPISLSLVAAAALGLALVAPATAGATTTAPRTTHPVSVKVLTNIPYGNFPYGRFAESMTMGRDGRLVLSVTDVGDPTTSTTHPVNVGQLWTVGPSGERARFGPRISIGYYGLFTGVVQDSTGAVYVAMGGADWPLEGFPDVTVAPGVFRIDKHSATRVLTLPSRHFPNGLAFHDGYLYVSDSTNDGFTGTTGAVWRFRPGKGNLNLSHATPWLTDPRLNPSAEAGLFGVNGIAFRGDWLYAVSSATGALVRVRVNENGTHGSVQTVLVDERLTTGDGLAFDPTGGLWITVNVPLSDAQAGNGCYTTTAPAVPSADVCGALFLLPSVGPLTQVASDPGWLDYPTQALPVIGSDGSPKLYVENGSLLSGLPSVVVVRIQR